MGPSRTTLSLLCVLKPYFPNLPGLRNKEAADYNWRLVFKSVYTMSTRPLNEEEVISEMNKMVRAVLPLLRFIQDILVA
jgi:hypothetical protein